MPDIASPPTTVEAELVLLSIGFDHPSPRLTGRGFFNPRIKGRAGVEAPSLFSRETCRQGAGALRRGNFASAR